MAYLLQDTILEFFSDMWRPAWKEPKRLFMVTDLEADTTQFVAYGTDGVTSFRVQGDKAQSQAAFLDLMAVDGAASVSPPTYVTYGNVIINPPTIPYANAVQQAFDAELSSPSLAA